MLKVLQIDAAESSLGLLRERVWRELLGLEISSWERLIWNDEVKARMSQLSFWKKPEVDFVLVDMHIPSQEFSGKFLEPLRSDPIVHQLRCFDTAWKGGAALEPRLLLSASLKHQILQRHPQLDIRATAYITGTGAMARCALWTALELGYRRVSLVNVSVEESQSEFNFFQQRLGVELIPLAASDLILRPNNGSLLMNTISEQKDSDFVANLTYLNYLSRDSLVVDLAHPDKASGLYEEAEQVGMKTLGTRETFFYRDWHLTQETSSRPFAGRGSLRNWASAQDFLAAATAELGQSPEVQA